MFCLVKQHNARVYIFKMTTCLAIKNLDSKWVFNFRWNVRNKNERKLSRLKWMAEPWNEAVRKNVIMKFLTLKWPKRFIVVLYGVLYNFIYGCKMTWNNGCRLVITERVSVSGYSVFWFDRLGKITIRLWNVTLPLTIRIRSVALGILLLCFFGKPQFRDITHLGHVIM